jgi:hypothetical protein
MQGVLQASSLCGRALQVSVGVHSSMVGGVGPQQLACCHACSLAAKCRQLSPTCHVSPEVSSG